MKLADEDEADEEADLWVRTVESLLGPFGVEDPVARLNDPFILVGATMIDDLLEVGLLDKLKDDLLERPTNELFLVFVVFKVVFKAEVKWEVFAVGVARGCANELLLDLTMILGMNPMFSSSAGGLTPLAKPLPMLGG